ncbi:MAG: hypothetical protein JWO82_2288 [Akkermansiaceae bacterium]|nr:hypothetical protein [Akkermansiaceae bacterium]
MRYNALPLIFAVFLLAIAVNRTLGLRAERKGTGEEGGGFFPGKVSERVEPGGGDDPRNLPVVSERVRKEAIAGLLSALRNGERLGDSPKMTEAALRAIGNNHVEEFRELLEALANATEVDGEARLEMTLAVTNFMWGTISEDQVLPLIDEVAAKFDREQQAQLLSCRAVVDRARQEPEKVVEWFQKHPEQLMTPEMLEVRESVLASIARKDAALAFSLMPGMQVTDVNEAARMMGRRVVDPQTKTAVLEEAREVMKGLPAEAAAALEKATLEGLGSGLNDRHRDVYGDQNELSGGDTYAAQVGWLESAGLDERQMKVVTGAMEGSSSTASNSQWLSWLEGKISSTDEVKPVAAIMGYWAAEEPAPAEQWLAASTPGVVRDAAVRAFVGSVKDVEAAQRAAMLLPEGGEREALLGQIGKRK